MLGVRRRARYAHLAVGAALVAVSALLAGCGQARATGPQLTLMSAQVPAPAANGTTDGYVIVVNKGPAVRLIGARSSAGGSIELRSPTGTGTMTMHTVSAITIPAHSLFHLAPNGSHLLITGSGPMRAGREITLTLVFSHGGAISVAALVTNPESGGSSYFLN